MQLIFIWVLVISLFSYLLIKRTADLNEKIVIMILIIILAFLNIKNANTNNKEFSLIDDILVIKQTFSREKKYNIKNLSNWNETQYHFLGFRTNRIIIIKTESGKEIKLIKNESKNFEKLSNHLNENYLNKFKN